MRPEGDGLRLPVLEVAGALGTALEVQRGGCRCWRGQELGGPFLRNWVTKRSREVGQWLKGDVEGRFENSLKTGIDFWPLC